MKIVAYLALTLLLGPIVFAMEQSNKVKFDMGGHKCTTTQDTALKSGSEFLKGLLGGNFASPTSTDGRIFIDCSMAVGQIFDHFMRHSSLLENADPRAAWDAADFFRCERLKELIIPRKESTRNWREISGIGWGGRSYFEEKRAYICPLCNQLISPTEADYFAHLIKSHDAKIVAFRAYGLPHERRYQIVINYADKCSPVDESYSAELWNPESPHTTHQCQRCKSEIPFCSSDTSEMRKTFFASHKAEAYYFEDNHQLIIYYCNNNKAGQ